MVYGALGWKDTFETALFDTPCSECAAIAFYGYYESMALNELYIIKSL